MKHPSWRLFRLAVPFSPWMILGVALGFATVASGIGLMTTSGYLISAAALQPSIADLQIAIVGVRFFGISRGVFRYLERYVTHEATFRLLGRLRTWFYQALEPLAPARLLEYRSGDLLARIVSDVDTLQDFYLRVLAPPAVAILTALLMAVLLGSLGLSLAVVGLTFLLLSGVGLPILMRAMSRKTGRLMVQVQADLNTVLTEGVLGISDLLAFGQHQNYLDRLQKLSGDSGKLQMQMARISGIENSLSGLLLNLATISVLCVAIPLVVQGRLDGVLLAMLVLAVISSFEAVMPLPQGFQFLEKSLESARRLFAIVDAQPVVVDPVLPVETPSGKKISITDLRFSYAEHGSQVLDGISLDLAQNKTVAIVGPSGAGKTTLVQLLLRFWDYSDGRITMDDCELRRCRQDDVRRLMAVVSQQIHFFDATARENLLLAKPDATEQELFAATRQAQVHETLLSLPEGYDTWIGEQGVRLSSGQRQRLAIARAILQDAPLLILDEPSAGLDAPTRQNLWRELRSVARGRTTLIISHHLLGLEFVDEIVVLDEGRTIERGRHHELMELRGLYHRMWTLQQQVLSGGKT
jgi:ATP-binding cassette subfamily C protein CydC